MAVTVAAWTLPSLAQTPRVEQPKETIIIFGEVGLDGQIQRPEGARIQSMNPVRFESLLRLMTDFLDELAVSVDDI